MQISPLVRGGRRALLAALFRPSTGLNFNWWVLTADGMYGLFEIPNPGDPCEVLILCPEDRVVPGCGGKHYSVRHSDAVEPR